ncbi:MAG: FkbM family methyltransferase, partial [Bacteroidota bacterium]
MKKELDDIESLLQKGKYVRIAANCHKYTILYLIKILCKFRIIKRFKVQTTPIFNFSFIIDLPAHPDIFLFGCKTSKSDFLLQRYLHNFLKRDSIFFDIGSSIGFYSLFVSRIVGTEGMVYSIEPSEMAYAILTQNTRDKNNINTLHLAIGDH